MELAPGEARKPYRSPRLEKIGKVADITLEVGTYCDPGFYCAAETPDESGEG